MIFFATSNVNKFFEATKALSFYDISVAMIRIKTLEKQDNDLENIAKASVLEVETRSNLPVIVEDAGLFISALKGFPGPYSKYSFYTLGLKRILKLMENESNRKAYFKSSVAYCDRNKNVRCFTGIVEGRIAYNIRGNFGFGFDPIFIPIDFPQKTFGEMTLVQKNQISHRVRALKCFAEWYKKASQAQFSKAFK
jgi:XTP/dITP diphosphohydrolase